MIQIRDLDGLKPEDIGKLTNLVNKELKKREVLYQRYKRKAQNSGLIFNEKNDNSKTTITFEKYIVDIASGYLGGVAPQYIVNDVKDKDKINLIRKLLDKIVGEDSYKEQLEIILDYITNYNDDGAEHYHLIKDYLMLSGCYERIYENSNNDIVYVRLDPLQTVAIYNYHNELIGLFRTWIEKDLNEKEIQMVELTDKYRTSYYKGSGDNWVEEKIKDDFGNEIDDVHFWGDVPAIVVEQEEGESIFECVVDLIRSYEQLIQNTRNTFQYNDEAKLKVVGYMPENPTTIEVEKTDADGNVYVVTEENQARQKEDEAVLKAKVFYTPDGSGDIGWVEKTINDSAIQNTLKTYIDLIMMMSFVPNITDLGFTKADNNSALQNKYFALSMHSIDLETALEKAYKRRWELILNRINIKKKKKFDFRDIKVVLSKNLPQNTDEVVNTWLKLRGLISDSTIIDNLPYDLDAVSEQNKVQEQKEEELENSIKEAQAFNNLGATNNQGNEPKEEKPNE